MRLSMGSNVSSSVDFSRGSSVGSSLGFSVGESLDDSLDDSFGDQGLVGFASNRTAVQLLLVSIFKTDNASYILGRYCRG